MRRGWKILIGLAVVLAVVLTVNTIVVEGETKPAEVTVPGGRILHLAGGDVQVLERGPRGGSPIVLLHCYTCAIPWWNRMIPFLTSPRLTRRIGARPHRVVAIDMRGFGGSEKPDSGYSMEDQAALVGEVLARLGVHGATVVGHSMGGTVATALTEVPGGYVKRLVIIDQAPEERFAKGLPFTAEVSRAPVLGPALWQVTPDSLVKEGLEVAFAPGFEVPDEFVEEFDRMTYTSYDSDGKEGAYMNAMPLDRRIEQQNIPLLAIFGDEDQIYDAKEALAAYRAVPGARTTTIPGAGHSPNVEKPGRTAALVLRFASPASHEMQEGVHNPGAVRGRP